MHCVFYGTLALQGCHRNPVTEKNIVYKQTLHILNKKNKTKELKKKIDNNDAKKKSWKVTKFDEIKVKTKGISNAIFKLKDKMTSVVHHHFLSVHTNTPAQRLLGFISLWKTKTKAMIHIMYISGYWIKRKK